MKNTQLLNSVKHHIEAIYETVEEIDYQRLSEELIDIMRLQESNPEPGRYINHWDEADCLVISYGDSILQEGENLYTALNDFLINR